MLIFQPILANISYNAANYALLAYFYRQWCNKIDKYQVCLICKSIATFGFVARRPLHLHDVHIAQHPRSRGGLNVQNIGGAGIPGALM